MCKFISQYGCRNKTQNTTLTKILFVVLSFPHRTFFCFQRRQSIVSKENNVFLPKRAMCCSQREHCVLAKENNLLFPKRTMCSFQRRECVLSQKNNVFAPTRTGCSSQKNNLTLPKPVRRNRYAETVTPKPSRRNVHDESLPRRRRNHPDETETTKNFFARINSGGHIQKWSFRIPKQTFLIMVGPITFLNLKRN